MAEYLDKKIYKCSRLGSPSFFEELVLKYFVSMIVYPWGQRSLFNKAPYLWYLDCAWHRQPLNKQLLNEYFRISLIIWTYLCQHTQESYGIYTPQEAKDSGSILFSLHQLLRATKQPCPTTLLNIFSRAFFIIYFLHISLIHLFVHSIAAMFLSICLKLFFTYQ